MSDKDHCCQQPENLKDTPENCKPQQIHICHGDLESHPCACRQQEEKKSE